MFVCMYGIISERAALTQASFNAYTIILTWLRGLQKKTSIFAVYDKST